MKENLLFNNILASSTLEREGERKTSLRQFRSKTGRDRQIRNLVDCKFPFDDSNSSIQTLFNRSKSLSNRSYDTDSTNHILYRSNPIEELLRSHVQSQIQSQVQPKMKSPLQPIQSHESQPNAKKVAPVSSQEFSPLVTSITIIYSNWWLILIVVTVALLVVPSQVSWIEIACVYGLIKLYLYIINNLYLSYRDNKWSEGFWPGLINSLQLKINITNTDLESPSPSSDMNRFDSSTNSNHSADASPNNSHQPFSNNSYPNNFNSNNIHSLQPKAPNYNHHLYTDVPDSSLVSGIPCSPSKRNFKPKSFKLIKKQMMTPFPLNLSETEMANEGQSIAVLSNLELKQTLTRRLSDTSVGQKLPRSSLHGISGNGNDAVYESINYTSGNQKIMNSSMSDPTFSELYKYCYQELLRITFNSNLIQAGLVKYEKLQQFYQLIFIQKYSLINFLQDYGNLILPGFINNLLILNLQLASLVIGIVLWPVITAYKLFSIVTSFILRSAINWLIIAPILLVWRLLGILLPSSTSTE